MTQPRRTPTDHGRGLEIARGAAPPAEPLAGVSSEAITTATRRVAERWRDEVAARQPDVGDPDMVAGVLAALALAIDQRRPGYVTQLVPRPAPTLADQLVEMLQTELLRSWSQTADTISPRAILGTLNALEDVRQALAEGAAQELGSHLTGVDGLRRAGQQWFLPNGLLTRAWLRCVEGDNDGAQEDLDEAWEIAERGPMRLHMADIHLYRARLFHDVKPYPWASPHEDLAAARKLIEQCGYLRRKEELEDAEAAAKNW